MSVHNRLALGHVFPSPSLSSSPVSPAHLLSATCDSDAGSWEGGRGELRPRLCRYGQAIGLTTEVREG